jgi:hypothetical protein
MHIFIDTYMRIFACMNSYAWLNLYRFTQVVCLNQEYRCKHMYVYVDTYLYENSWINSGNTHGQENNSLPGSSKDRGPGSSSASRHPQSGVYISIFIYVCS